MENCKHCGMSFDEMSTSQKANHTRWCDKNPKAKQYRDNQVVLNKEIQSRQFGEVVEFNVVCGSCSTPFTIEARENLFDPNAARYCSRSCANSVGGKKKSELYHGDDTAYYTTVCWRHHERACLICGESNIVAAHHVNKIHSDNRPENLVPLCPTHHQYMHSKHSVLIQNKVDDYIKRFTGL